MPTYLTIDDLAKRWGKARNALYQRRYRGQLPEPDVPGRLVWLLETIEAYERTSNGSDETD